MPPSPPHARSRARRSARARAGRRRRKTRFDALLADAWEQDKRENPLFATSTGDHRFDDRLPSVGAADLDRRAAAARACSSGCGRSTRRRSPRRTSVSYAMFERELGTTSRAPVPRLPHPDHEPTAASTPGSRACRRRCRSRPSRTTRTTSRACARSRPTSTSTSSTCARGCAAGFTCARVALEGYDATMRAARGERPGEERLLEAVRQLPGRRARGASTSGCARRAARRSRRPWSRPTSALLEFFTKEYLPGARATTRGLRAARGQGLLRVAASSTSRRSTPRPRQVHAIGLAEVERIRARDGRRRAEGRLQGHVRRVPRVPAHRPALLREDARRAAEAGLLDREADGRQAAVALRTAAAPALRRRAGARRHRAQVHGRALRRRAARRPRAGHLLGQHLRARDAAALRARGADAARGRARPPPADVARAGARRDCRSSAATAT